MNVIAFDWPHTEASSVRTKGPLAPFLAHLRGAQLDRKLAQGVEPWHTPVYAARCLQLTTERSRHALARSLERLVEEADEQPRLSLSSVVRPSRARVHEARPLLLTTASRMRSDIPVHPRAVAAIRILLSDGAGPVYGHGDPETLKLRLQTIAAWMDGES
jgi:hypothetical protein